MGAAILFSYRWSQPGTSICCRIADGVQRCAPLHPFTPVHSHERHSAQKTVHLPPRTHTWDLTSVMVDSPGACPPPQACEDSQFGPSSREGPPHTCDPQYAHVAFHDGLEDTVSLRDLAPMGSPTALVDNPSSSSPPGAPVKHGLPATLDAPSQPPPLPPPPLPTHPPHPRTEATPPASPTHLPPPSRHPHPATTSTPQPRPLRRSKRTIRAPVRFDPSHIH